MHEDFGVPFFTEHFRALTAGFEYKFAEIGKP
jgi:hypothetical protein